LFSKVRGEFRHAAGLVVHELLPDGLKDEPRDGLFANFYPDGQLKTYGIYDADGSCDGSWALHLQHDAE
jgi:hypothetical protein